MSTIKYTDMTREQLLGELKKMEQRLTELEAPERNYREMLEALGVAISIQDTGFKILYQNQAHRGIMGNHAGGFCYRAYEHSEAVCEDCPVAMTFQDGISHATKKKSTDANGKTIHVEISSFPLRDETGKIIAVIETVRDITRRIAAQEALRLAEAKLRSLIEQSLVGIYIFQDNRLPYVNPKAADIFGYTPDEIISTIAVGDIVFEEDKELVDENIRKLIQDEIKTAQLTFRAKRKDGAVIDIEVQGTRTVYDGKPAIIGAFLDITGRKKMETELIKIRKLESLSDFASGIAHEYNNLLTAIIGNLSLAKMYAKPGYEVYDVLTEAEKASIRAKDLTLQLLTFAEGRRPVKKTVYLQKSLQNWIESGLSESRITPELAIQENLWPVEADEAQIHRALANILSHARQSMPGGGFISVRTENVDIEASSGLPLKKGFYILISIEDHGVGIPEKYLQKIFDPFSSVAQKSSGLGLASSYSIIKMHEGHITVDSKLGVGTKFHIYLPAFQGSVSPSEETMKLYAAGRGTVLVMDDEEIVRLVVSKLLEQCGYDTVLVRNGEEMLRKYKEALESGRPFDAVILDLVIEGGMGGQEAIGHLLEIDPHAKALISSGYSNAPEMSRYMEFGFKGFLAKPYRLEELGKVLHEVIIGKEE
ncbi:MAG: PAS domain S-box protein [Nitrospirota bacterium]|nr:PAS domain S-box protein [Nitrospirota bacterium]